MKIGFVFLFWNTRNSECASIQIESKSCVTNPELIIRIRDVAARIGKKSKIKKLARNGHNFLTHLASNQRERSKAYV